MYSYYLQFFLNIVSQYGITKLVDANQIHINKILKLFLLTIINAKFFFVIFYNMIE